MSREDFSFIKYANFLAETDENSKNNSQCYKATKWWYILQI